MRDAISVALLTLQRKVNTPDMSPASPTIAVTSGVTATSDCSGMLISEPTMVEKTFFADSARSTRQCSHKEPSALAAEDNGELMLGSAVPGLRDLLPGP